ncbi:MAG: hypothetical protein AABY22_26175 [Nanoarchaeota archaeon]
MMDTNIIYYSANIALAVCIFFIIFLMAVVRIVQLSPRKKNGGESFSKNMLVLVILSTLIIIIATAVLTSYFSNKIDSQKESNNKAIESQLESSLQRVDYISSRSSVDSGELALLRYQLEDALIKLRQQGSRTKIVYITNNGY